MLYKQSGLALLMLLALAGGAEAGLEAHTGKGSWIDIRGPVEEEGDALLRLRCRGFGLIDTHLGGAVGIGKGEHEAVTVTLSSGGLKAEVKGLSIFTEDSEMTGGTELLTALMPNHDAFGVLTSGKEIELKSPDKTERFTLGPKPTAALKAFLKKCG
jgi:hypothetical protein